MIFEYPSLSKAKAFDVHPTRPLIAIITANQTFELWNYEEKLCMKAFSTATLISKELNKSANVRDVKFFDKEVVYWQFGSMDFTCRDFSLLDDSSLIDWIIFLSENRVILYDYYSDNTKAIPASLIDNKTPKFVEVISTRVLAIGCMEGIIKIFDMRSWTTIRTLKGFHTKPISCILVYKINLMAQPSLISASSEGEIACWNIESERILFNFTYNKKNIIESSMAGAEVLSLSYLTQHKTIVSLSTGSVTLFNAYSGQEIIRFKPFKDSGSFSPSSISLLPHPYLSRSCIVAVSSCSSEIFCASFLPNENLILKNDGLFPAKKLTSSVKLMFYPIWDTKAVMRTGESPQKPSGQPGAVHQLLRTMLRPDLFFLSTNTKLLGLSFSSGVMRPKICFHPDFYVQIGAKTVDPHRVL